MSGMQLKRALARCFLLGMLAAAAASAAHAQGSDPIKYAGAGLEGYVKSGHWLPIDVELDAAAGDVRDPLAVEVGHPPSRVHYVRPVQIAQGGRQRHTLIVRIDRPLNAVPLLFRNGARDIRLREIDDEDALVLAVSDDKSGFHAANGVRLGPYMKGYGYGMHGYGPPGSTSSQRQVYVAHCDADGLYDSPLAYSSVDAIALGNVSLRRLYPAQKRAIRDWVLDGGTLVVGGGSDTGRLRAPFLADLLPVTDPAPQVLPSLAAMGEQWPVRINGRLTGMLAGTAVVARGLPRPGAHVWLEQDGVPLIVSWAQGNGRVIFFAFDSDQAPVRGWAGQGPMWKEILAGRQEQLVTRDLLYEATQPNGTQVLNSTLASAVADVPAMDLPGLGVVGLFFAAYLICLVPLNYFILRRFDRREYAWATTPAIVLIFFGVAFAIGYGLRGGNVLLYRLDVVEAAAGSPTASGIGYAGLFSPRRGSYTLESRGMAGLHEAPTSDDSPYGGGGSAPAGGDYTVVEAADATRVQDLPINMWSMRIFSQAVRTDLGGGVTASLRYGGSGLEGEITNHTSRRLDGGILVLAQTTQPVGAMAPGATVTLKGTASMGVQPMPGQPVGGRGPRQERVTQDAVAAVQQAILSSSAATQPLLVAWGQGASEGIELKGRPSREMRVSVTIFHLDPPATLAHGTLSLAAGMIPGRVIDLGSNASYVYQYGQRDMLMIGSSGSIVKQFSLPAGKMTLTRLTVHIAGRENGPGHGLSTRNLALRLRDARTGRWVSVPVMQNAPVPHPERYLDGEGHVRVKLVYKGGSSQYCLRELDLTATCEVK